MVLRDLLSDIFSMKTYFFEFVWLVFVVCVEGKRLFLIIMGINKKNLVIEIVIETMNKHMDVSHNFKDIQTLIFLVSHRNERS